MPPPPRRFADEAEEEEEDDFEGEEEEEEEEGYDQEDEEVLTQQDSQQQRVKRGRWAEPPAKLTGLRACLACMLIKTYEQFLSGGCDNCEEALHLREDGRKIAECTTTTFDGMVAITSQTPNDSWVARWQFATTFLPGVYALRVDGDVSEETAKDLQEAGLPNIGKLLQLEDAKAAAKTATAN